MTRDLLWTTVSAGLAVAAHSQNISETIWPKAAGPNLGLYDHYRRTFPDSIIER